MNVPIGFGTAASSGIAAGGACIGSQITVNATGRLLSCDSTGKWTDLSTWRSPVPNFASLPPTDNPGDVRVTTTDGHAYMYSGPVNGWTALALDQFNNMTMNNLNASNVATTLDMTAGRNMVAAQNVTATLGSMTAGIDMIATRNVVATVSAIAANGLFKDYATAPAFSPSRGPNPVQGPGGPCNYIVAGKIWLPTGSVTGDSRGISMFCRSPDNIWVYENNTTTPPP